MVHRLWSKGGFFRSIFPNQVAYSARLSRQHNNTNCVAFGARVVGIETAKDIVDAWLGAEYEGGRHQVRIDMLAEIETTQALAATEA